MREVLTGVYARHCTRAEELQETAQKRFGTVYILIGMLCIS